ncbi:hypothetical protein N3K66_001852 [Trichothecium roseum]|uniref:Uncharacterized protein n=1 Tax=Trichothecium roseum TaxID=47278 RepID=A0ACC0V7X9_9HYPO|nr:hypothetical protein N3K66_001852 [Trichothecium roseum]
MPAIPVYSKSPINAAKPSGVTPQTASSDQNDATAPPATATSMARPTTTQSYPEAQPGATPMMPEPTPVQSSQQSGPPPPQPGAVPVAPGTKSPLPPPPKTGEKLQPTQTSATMPMPPQMSYPPPSSTYTGSTSSTAIASGPQPTFLQGSADYSHPPGYQQDTHASEFSSHQRAAHNASLSQDSGNVFSDGDGEGVWDTAKKWASAAGGRLAAAENEVWKKINKD